MDLRINREHQARLDLVEGLKVYVAGNVMPALRQDFEKWRDEEKPTDSQLRDAAYMHAKFDNDPLYQASRGLQRISQESMWREVIYGLDQRKEAIEKELDTPSDAPGSLTLEPALQMPVYYEKMNFICSLVTTIEIPSLVQSTRSAWPPIRCTVTGKPAMKWARP